MQSVWITLFVLTKITDLNIEKMTTKVAFVATFVVK